MSSLCKECININTNNHKINNSHTHRQCRAHYGLEIRYKALSTNQNNESSSLILTLRGFAVGGEFVVIRKSVQLLTGSVGQTTLSRSLYTALSLSPGQVPVGPGITRGNSLQRSTTDDGQHDQNIQCDCYNKQINLLFYLNSIIYCPLIKPIFVV